MNNSTLKFWWNDTLKQLKNDAILSHRAWLDAGKPASGLLFDIRKHNKYAYKLAIRKQKDSELNGITNSLHDFLLSHDIV